MGELPCWRVEWQARSGTRRRGRHGMSCWPSGNVAPRQPQPAGTRRRPA
ncbi:hypothetical protein HMPREF0321_2279, partial [Dermacoccus sp. Ellin185]